ncbi:MAG: YXWGXW repeat-containing protein [Candidatus Eremiobacteraeota bacterium]|nr:YXWGXW repeat-containing protein [Candidatus Eremiobacteraeota bacterium]
MFSGKGGNLRIIRSIPAIIAALLITAIPLPSPAQFTVGVGFTIGTPPPALPVYTVPPAPYPNYMWTPGYWAWGPAGYYWVPGTWVAPPSVGLYWTPGYWGYSGGGYGWNAGYWGPTVGFYGGVNYGFGYYGSGFVGGIWRGGSFAYNTAVLPVNRTVVNNVYVNKTVINKTVYNNSRVSYNGGTGGIAARPTSAQLTARRTGIAPTTVQRQQATVASQDRALYANVNKGKPPVTAVAKPVTDPKQLPNYAPVTSADKAAAQKQVKTTTPSGSANKMSSANKAPATTTNKKPAATKPEAPMTTTQKHPPSTTHKPQNAMYGQPAAHAKPAGYGQPAAHAKPAGYGQPAHNAKPAPSGGNKQPPQGANGKQKPPPA